MPKTSKVVPLTDDHRRVIATDEESKRFILGIGNQRLAFDSTTRITKLPPKTGDEPATILPIESKKLRRS